MPPILAPLAALAAASYAPDAEAAKFAWMSPARLKALMGEFGYASGKKSNGALTKMTPEQYLRATTANDRHLMEIAQEAGKYDPYRMQNQRQFPFLEVDPNRPEIYGHEGRHRMAASFQDQEPRYVILRDTQGAPLEKWRELSNKKLGGQPFYEMSNPAKGEDIPLGEVIPLEYGLNPKDFQQYLDIPLKQVAINLKPVGKNVHPDDLTAYSRGTVPYGKIPPPTERFTHPRDVFKGDDYHDLMDRWRKEHNGMSWIDYARQFYPEGVK